MRDYYNEGEVHSGLPQPLSGETHTTDHIIAAACGDIELCIEGWLTAIAPMFTEDDYGRGV